MGGKIDWILAVLVVLLLSTLLGFFTGAFPYPYGWIIITGLLAWRIKTRMKPD